jgi:uncharacterized membrane protein
MAPKWFSSASGFALFLAIAFFVQYSSDHNRISPQMRIALGYLTGITLIASGFRLHQSSTANTAISLLGITLLKLFLHDLSELRPLCLIGSFLGLALISILASFPYQKFTAPTKPSSNPLPSPPPHAST